MFLIFNLKISILHFYFDGGAAGGGGGGGGGGRGGGLFGDYSSQF
jgi:hypothetical protein